MEHLKVNYLYEIINLVRYVTERHQVLEQDLLTCVVYKQPGAKPKM